MPYSARSEAQRRRGRVQLLMLGVLFIAPLAAAFVMYFAVPGLRPEHTTNVGELVLPMRPLPDLTLERLGGSMTDERSLTGLWVMVQLLNAPCDALCAQRLLLTRQTRTALNDKRDRVRRVLIVSDPAWVPDAALLDRHPDLTVLIDRDALGKRAWDFFMAPQNGEVELLDPLGNWMMRYPPGRSLQMDFKGLQKDLKRLLTISQIG